MAVGHDAPPKLVGDGQDQRGALQRRGVGPGEQGAVGPDAGVGLLGGADQGGEQRRVAVREAVQVGDGQDGRGLTVAVVVVDRGADIEHVGGVTEQLAQLRRHGRVELRLEHGRGRRAVQGALLVPAGEAPRDGAQRGAAHVGRGRQAGQRDAADDALADALSGDEHLAGAGRVEHALQDGRAGADRIGAIRVQARQQAAFVEGPPGE